jgi:hypothetical protein
VGVTPTKQPTRERQDIVASVQAWRRETLERAGFPRELAEKVATSEADLHLAVGLVEQGCTPQLAAEILL